MISKWYIKDISKITGISVQTLHYYDRIGLLKSSIRLSNTYRVYSEVDLLKLQKIIALKFFGFNLSKIKVIINNSEKSLEPFLNQVTFLEKKANILLDARRIIKKIISDVDDTKSIPWEKIIHLIELYNMAKSIEKTWVKEILKPNELEDYLEFENYMNSNSEKKKNFLEKWKSILEEINFNIQSNPQSLIGIKIGENCMKCINELYGKKYARLRTQIFKEGFEKGYGLQDSNLTTEVVSWMGKAIDSYWRDRIYRILNQIGTGISDETIFNLWNEVLNDMCGDDIEHKKKIYDIALNDEKVSKKAKEWLTILSDITKGNNYLVNL